MLRQVCSILSTHFQKQRNNINLPYSYETKEGEPISLDLHDDDDDTDDKVKLMGALMGAYGHNHPNDPKCQVILKYFFITMPSSAELDDFNHALYSNCYEGLKWAERESKCFA